MAESRPQHQAQYRGWLYKWTNYLRGYQKRWFVLQNGLLSYYRNQAEMAHTCRGTINLANAFIHTEDSNTIVISNSGSSTYYLKATSEVERQRWVTALELAKAEAVKMQDSESDEEEETQPDRNELQNTVKLLTSKLEDMKTCNDLIAKHGSALQRALSELESMDIATEHGSKAKVVNERATMFRITSNAMINACTEYLEVAQSQTKRLQRLFDYEHEQRLKLEDMVEQLAKDQVSLEVQAKNTLKSVKNVKEMANVGSDEDDDDFVDAFDYPADEFKVALPHEKPTHRRTISDLEDGQIIPDDRSSNSSDTEIEGQEARVYSHKNKSDSPKRTTTAVVKSQHRRNASQEFKRTESSESSISHKKFRRPVIPIKPNYSLNLWSIMKNCIGKELSKIPMPVNFNEPLSMLQRLSEDFEYSGCLDRAAECDTSAEELVHLAAFTISSYSTTTNRSTKPFNPLLGETYECDRTDDYGWRSIAEQVSHHPPTAALHTEGRGWKVWQEFTMASKFRGKYLQIIPLEEGRLGIHKGDYVSHFSQFGEPWPYKEDSCTVIHSASGHVKYKSRISHAQFKKSGNHYTWRKVTTTVHNIIVGKLWVDNHGEMDIINHTNGDKCHLKFSTYSYFSRDIPRKVTGVITTKDGDAKWVLTGTWDKKMEGAKILHVDESVKGKPVFETGPHITLWEKKPLPPGAEKMYFFTRLALELNEPEEGVAPTDCRLRPDQRLMEEGKWDEANKIKLQLEEKQRTVRKQRESDVEEARKRGEDGPQHKPTWFSRKTDKVTGNPIHTYDGKYWDCKQKQDWAKCPNIYL